MTQQGLEVVGVRAVVEGFEKYVRDTSQIQRSTNAMSGGVAKTGTSFGASARKIAEFGTALVGVNLGISAVGQAFKSTIGASIGFESAFAGVRKTVNATEDEFDALSAGLREMSKEIPLSVNGLASITEAAGQLGIQNEALLSFTATMAMLGETTNLSANEAATSLARLANITKLPQDEFDRLGSTIVALGNNFATTEAEIVDLSLRLAGAGAQIGLSEAQILGFATALSSLGINAESGGTALSRVFVEIEKAVRSGGEDLEAFAEAAGLSAEEFRRAYEEDAAGAITTFIEGLGKIGDAGGDLFGVLEKLELDNVRVRDALLRTAGAGDIVRDALEQSGAAWEDNTALQVEFARRAETSAAQFQLLKNRINDLGIDIGNTLVPPLLEGATAMTGWIEALQVLGPALPIITTAVVALVAALAVTKMLAFANAIGSIADAAGKAVAGNAYLLAFVAAVIALDVALRAFTGEGILGQFARDESAAEKATSGLNDELERQEQLLGSSAARNQEVLLRDLAAATREYTTAQQAFLTELAETSLLNTKLTGTYQDVNNAAAQFGSTALATAANLDANGASAREILDIYGQLPAEIKAIVYEESIFQSKSRELNDTIFDLEQQQDAWIQELKNLPPVLNDVSDSADGAGDSLISLGSAALKAANQAYEAIGPLYTLEAELREIAGLQLDKPSENPFGFISDQDAFDLVQRLGQLGEDGSDELAAGLKRGSGGVKKAAEEVAEDAIGAFTMTLKAGAQSKDLADEFGKAGGRVADAFSKAVVEKTSAAGEALADALQQMFDDAESAGIPISEDSGQRLIDALATGIELGTPEAINAALDAMRAITETFEQGAKTAVDIFFETLGEIDRDQQLEAKFGSKGASLYAALTAGMETGSESSIQAAARIAREITGTLDDNLRADEAKRLGTALMAALGTALRDGGAAAIATLDAILAEINATLGQIDVAGFNGGADAPPTMGGGINPTEFNQALIDLARDIGLTGPLTPGILNQLASILAAGNTPYLRENGQIGAIPAGAPPRGDAVTPEANSATVVPSVSNDNSRIINIDISDVVLNGTPEENAAQIAAHVAAILAAEQTTGAFDAGVR